MCFSRNKLLALLITGIFILLIIGLLSCKKPFSNEKNQNNRLIQLENDSTGSYDNSDFAVASEQYTFDLVDTNTFEGEYSDEEMGDYQLSFMGEIENLNSIKVGKGIGEYGGMYIMLSPVKLQIYNSRDDSISAEYDIHMQFDKYIKVSIIADLQDHAIIEISSNGYSERLDVCWSARQGAVFVSTDESAVLKNCNLNYYCNGWNKPIWLMGDSYFNCSASSRWTSYLTKDGYENYMLNGYPGRNSDKALDSLHNMLGYSTPKEIIWCMGMNDSDDANSINPDWKKDVEEVMDICNEYDIELVLTTIPNCPTVNNKYKNKYVVESGYRYIDFANAVGAYNDSEWDEGMLEGGDMPCHPTENGAMVLYNKAVATCPEILY